MFEEHTVRVDEDFYRRNLKPYSGCPRGAEGIPGVLSSSDESFNKYYALRDWLGSYSKNQLKGTDDTFICIPKCIFEALMEGLK